MLAAGRTPLLRRRRRPSRSFDARSIRDGPRKAPQAAARDRWNHKACPVLRISIAALTDNSAMSPARALVIVLGDLGRSPRMLRHARSLSEAGFDVDLVGFAGEGLPAEVSTGARIRVRYVAAFAHLRASRTAALTLAVALLRQFALAVALASALARLRRPSVVLVQNPPAFPLLPIVLVYCSLSRATLIIDWHNLTAAMLRVRLRNRLSSVVCVVERAEMKLARHAGAHLAASQALADRLNRGHLRATVVLDRATAAFVPAARKVGAEAGVPTIIAPTSWGPDEDFALLANAALLCEERGLRLRFLVTGNGERRAAFERDVAAMSLRRVEIVTKWFEADEYPRALANADLGLSLHRSASGADIPMKIPEMLACGVPVCAIDCGPALREQMRESRDGLFFSNAEELAGILRSLCATWPHAPDLDRMRASVRACERPRWDDEWNRQAHPVIKGAMA